MNETVMSISAVFAGVAGHLAAGVVLGLVAGYFGRTALGLAVVVILVTLITDTTGTCVDYLARGVSYFPHAQIVAFLNTTGGIAAVGGVILGLFLSTRRARA
ncbi:MAG: hypothetical protein J7M19_08430 [Planctomycetes bacterium]|nr:hypothetical protein [Planctomycetota bacterium]